MGVFLQLLSILFVVFLSYIVTKFLETPPLPNLDETAWWGPGRFSDHETGIREFTVNISDEILNDLRRRLSTPRTLSPPLEGIDHQYGINTKFLRHFLAFWREKYDWRQRELYLNKFPQFIIQLQGLEIHYLHIKPPENLKNPKSAPLLLLHGWPGTPRDFYELIPLLQQSKHYFEIVVPSIPGVGFSTPARKPGLGLAQLAVVLRNFMLKLGFGRWYVHGHAEGGALAQTMATLHPVTLYGLHSTMCYSNSIYSELRVILAGLIPSLIVRKEHAHKLYPLVNVYKFHLEETGYLHLQATKPETIGVALNDSPVGLAAYLLEKYITFTNASYRNVSNFDLDAKLSFTAILDNVMIYLVTNSITSSMRIFADTFNVEQYSLQIDLIPTTVPTSCTRFAHEIYYQPDGILKDKFHNLVYSSDREGGHFPALENPKLLAEEIIVGFEKIQEELSR